MFISGKTIDNLGRVVIPISMRRSLGIDRETPLKISEEDQKIIIELAIEKCRICGSVDVVSPTHLCRNCIEQIKHA